MKRSGFKSRRAKVSLPSASAELNPLSVVPSIAIDEGVTVICPCESSELTKKIGSQGHITVACNPKINAKIRKSALGIWQKVIKN